MGSELEHNARELPMGAQTQTVAPATGAGWFDEAVRRHYPLVYAIAYQRLGRVQDAEDAAQDAFLRAFRGRQGLRDQSRTAGWLARIAYRAAADLGRRRPARSALPEELPSFDRPPWDGEHERVQRAIARLSESDALLVNLRFMEGLKAVEIAEQLDEKPTTIRVRLHRALNQLRELLGKEIDDVS